MAIVPFPRSTDPEILPAVPAPTLPGPVVARPPRLPGTLGELILPPPDLDFIPPSQPRTRDFALLLDAANHREREAAAWARALEETLERVLGERDRAQAALEAERAALREVRRELAGTEKTRDYALARLPTLHGAIRARDAVLLTLATVRVGACPWCRAQAWSAPAPVHRPGCPVGLARQLLGHPSADGAQ
jgi:hypothetical protein